MRGNPGKIIQLPDKRHCIVYNDQPLLKDKGKVILSLLDENLAPIIGDDKKPKIIMKDASTFKEEMQGAKVIGYVD